MANGKDGFNALSPEEGAEVLVDDENGVLISMMLRQYFLSLKVIGKWSRGGTIRDFFGGLKKDMQAKGEVIESVEALQHELLDDDEYTSGSESDIEKAKAPSVEEIMDEDVVDLIQKTGRKWARLAGVRTEEQGSGFNVGWTSAIAPKLEGRIVDVAVKES